MGWFEIVGFPYIYIYIILIFPPASPINSKSFGGLQEYKCYFFLITEDVHDNQTWQWKIHLYRCFPISTSMYRGFPIAMFGYRSVSSWLLGWGDAPSNQHPGQLFCMFDHCSINLQVQYKFRVQQFGWDKCEQCLQGTDMLISTLR